MNKKLLLMAGVLSIIGSSAMADNITQGPGDITIWRTSDGNVVGNTVIDSNSISVNDNSMTATTGNKNRTLITTDSVVVHSGTFNRDRIEGGLYNNGGVAFSKFQYNPGEDVPSKRSFATLTLEYGLELQKAEPGSNPGMDNRRTSLLNTEELRIRKIEDNSVYSQIEVASNGLKIMDGNPKQPTSRKNLEFSSEKVDVGGQTINNVAEGVDGTDAVNVNQLERYVASKIKPVKSGDNITVNPNYDFFRNVDSFSVDLNKDLTDMNSVKFKNEEFDTESEINHASASFYNKKQNEGSALTSHSLEMNTKNGSSSLDGTSLTISNGIDGNIATMGANGFATETKDGKHLEFSSDNVTVAGQQIHDVAKGIDDTDAVNVKQLKDYVAANGSVDTNTITTVTNGDNATVTGITDASGNKEFKVAVNKDLTDMNSARFVSGDNETKVDGTEITFKSDKDQVHTEVQAGAIGVSTEKNRTVIYEDGVIIGNAAETELSTSDSSGLSVTNADGKKVEFKLNNVTVGDNQIHDVATGIADTDAVNVKQLKDYVAANGGVDTNTITTVINGDNTTVTGTTDASGNKEFKVAVNKDLTDMNSATFGNGDERNVVDKTGVRTFNGSVNTGITANGVVIENTDTLEQASYTGSGMQASDDNATIRFSTIGIDAGNQIINGVKSGVADTDAVNVKQLKEYMSTNDKDTITTVKAGNNIEVTANGHDYTVSLNKDVVDKIDNATAGVKANADTIKSNTDAIKANTDAIKANTADIADNKAQIDNLVNQIGNNDTKINNMISNTRHEARRGIASASALAALHPLDYNPDHKVDVMGGVGHYRGKTAVALGAAYRPNENLMFTVGTAINGKDSSVNAGVSYKVGANDSTYKSQASLAKDVEDLKQIVAKLQAELEEARKK